MTSEEGNEGDSETRGRKQTQAGRDRLSLRNVYLASDVDPAHIAVGLSLANGFLLIQQCGPEPPLATSLPIHDLGDFYSVS